MLVVLMPGSLPLLSGGLGNMLEAEDLELTGFLFPIISDSPFYRLGPWG